MKVNLNKLQNREQKFFLAQPKKKQIVAKMHMQFHVIERKMWQKEEGKIKTDKRCKIPLKWVFVRGVDYVHEFMLHSAIN